MANLWLDPGEIYIIGEYEIGTSTPTGVYKIGMVQNESTSAGRLDTHQTGNPNRLFIDRVIPTEATYLVEQLIHSARETDRIALEWFRLPTPADIAQVESEIRALETLHGPRIVNLRSVYFSAPNSGSRPGLTSAEISNAEQLRDDAYDICRDMMQLKYTSETLKFQILLANGIDASVDSVTKVKVEGPYTEFSETLLPPALKTQYMTKQRKRKDDFRFVFTANTGKICDLKTTTPWWKNLFSTEEAAYTIAKNQWGIMEPTITRATINTVVQPRTTAIESLHTEYTRQCAEYSALEKRKKTIEIQLKLLCYDYEEISNVCQWKRGPQSNLFNTAQFKISQNTAYLLPAHQAPRGDKVTPSVIKYKAWS
jgi:hypothetical protein